MSLRMPLITLIVAILLKVYGNELKSDFSDPTWHEVIDQGGMHFGSGRHKRFVVIDQVQDDELHQPCILPNGMTGHCRHLRYCVQDEFKKDFLNFMEYVCIINQESLGSCCPDDARRGGVQGLAGELPASAPQDQDVLTNRISSKTESRGCGMSTREQKPGESIQQANPREWPWMAYITLDGIQHCGGVLITDTHVLTAAHCVQKEGFEDLGVRLGEYDVNSDNETRTSDYVVVEMRVHERFQRSNYMNDIAVLKLDRPVMFNTYIWPICLPPPEIALVNKTATLIGWGTQWFGGPRSTVLMEVSMPVWDLSECTKCFCEQVFEENICAGGKEKDACQYDSGGPLMYQMPSGRWVVIGVVSWGLRCGEPTHPGIYTAVDKYRAWIVENTKF